MHLRLLRMPFEKGAKIPLFWLAKLSVVMEGWEWVRLLLLQGGSVSPFQLLLMRRCSRKCKVVSFRLFSPTQGPGSPCSCTSAHPLPSPSLLSSPLPFPCHSQSECSSYIPGSTCSLSGFFLYSYLLIFLLIHSMSLGGTLSWVGHHLMAKSPVSVSRPLAPRHDQPLLQAVLSGEVTSEGCDGLTCGKAIMVHVSEGVPRGMEWAGSHRALRPAPDTDWPSQVA